MNSMVSFWIVSIVFIILDVDCTFTVIYTRVACNNFIHIAVDMSLVVDRRLIIE